MYHPTRYEKSDDKYIIDFISSHPFATLVMRGQRLLATHIPVLPAVKPQKSLDDLVLFGHIANHNEQYRFLKNGVEALLIFQGAHGYISSSWYREKDISTWDYSAVHINCRLKVQSSHELEQSLSQVVNYFEKDQDKPLFYKDIPDKVIEDQLPHITGFWCHPTKIQAVAKLHQGHDSQNVDSVIRHLEGKADAEAQKLSEDLRKEHGNSR